MGSTEKCGVVGIFSNSADDVARAVYYGLWTLQHRGQETSGIACSNGRRIVAHKGKGLVAHVYNEADLVKLTGHIAIGHNRYSTFGKGELDHSQPVYYQQNVIALAHNGNLPVVTKLKAFLKKSGIPTQGLNDSEMMYKAIESLIVKGKSLVEAVKICYPLFTGSFSLLVMSKNELVALRDNAGIRPLCLGKFNHSYVVASESCALDAIGAEFIREIGPGEMLVLNKQGIQSLQLSTSGNQLDVFEFIYFARPDSLLLGQNVYEVRKKLGQELARELNGELIGKAKIQADIVVPVPDSSIPAAIGFANESGIVLEQALVKNRYIHRTFIAPSQKQRSVGVNMKLNPIKSLLRDKNVILVDDSVVRGTTSKLLVKMVRDSGAKKVHLIISSPPVLYPDFYGIDTPNQNDLIAATLKYHELMKYLEVDSLHFLSYQGMLKAIGIPEENLCTSCFTGKYPLGIGKSNERKIRKITFY